ncbi:MAG: hypothetical protein MRK02_13995 [Candidatus Scalindua sp.]|nr:hypothetical protein [Candidatus Scalindua sp.]
MKENSEAKLKQNVTIFQLFFSDFYMMLSNDNIKEDTELSNYQINHFLLSDMDRKIIYAEKSSYTQSPPLPPLIFIGKALTIAPVAGNLSMLVTFSKPGIYF